MSRGPGKWQRAILKVLETERYVSMQDIFGRSYGRTPRFVFRRAAERLAAQGLVTLEWVNHEVYVTRRENSRDVSHLSETEVSVTYFQNS